MTDEWQGGSVPQPGLSRRSVLAWVSGLGVGSMVFQRSLAREASARGAIDVETIQAAEWVSGVELTAAERELMLDGIREMEEDLAALRALVIDNAEPPALFFEPLEIGPVEVLPSAPPRVAAEDSEPTEADFPFATLSQLGAALRSGRVTSVELTRLALERLERFDPRLECVITRTEELSLQQAERADAELAAGRDRGPLHGIPWGAKDLLAVPGYPTTWGATPYREQVREETAAVVDSLTEAGAVLVAKLTLGALAWGDVWFGGKTRNPWDLEQGSSGSSAGSAAATAAGLVGFAIGSETWGSIISPCTRCGATGLRPTFGRVSRHGAMALSWSMDKLGPITRSVDDCGHVLAAIHGADRRDPTTRDKPFAWPVAIDPETIRLGYVPAWFEGPDLEGVEDDEDRRRAEVSHRLEAEALKVIEGQGFQLVEVAMPDDLPISSLSWILTAEAATLFDDLTRSGRDDELVRQVDQAWPNVFRQGQFVPAVEYLRANRVRRRLQLAMEETIFSRVDAWVTPSFRGDQLLATNLTGHPAVVLPIGFVDGSPHSLTFVARLWDEARLLAIADRYQLATDFHRQHPEGFA